MPTSNQRPKAPDPRAEPEPASTPLARVALRSAPAERTPSAHPTVVPSGDEGASVVERLLNEVLSDLPPKPSLECDAHRRRIDELEAVLKIKEKRVTELEMLLAQDGSAEILKTELDAAHAHGQRLEECVERLTKERDHLQTLADEVEVLRSSVDFAAAEAATLEESLRAERAKNEELESEVARLRAIAEPPKTPRMSS
jgi:hypothetical protein